MSLHRDYSHYYGGTWIVVQEDGKNLPMYVMQIRDSREFDEHDYSDEHEAALQFEGNVYVKDSRGRVQSTMRRISVKAPNLILESPDVGYVMQQNNTVSWTHINPVRQRLKGLTSNKIRQVQINDNTALLMYNLFNPEFDGLVNRYLYVQPISGKVFYKGCEVGRADPSGGTANVPCSLINKFRHVKRDLEGAGYQVTLVEGI